MVTHLSQGWKAGVLDPPTTGAPAWAHSRLVQSVACSKSGPCHLAPGLLADTSQFLSWSLPSWLPAHRPEYTFPHTGILPQCPR